MNTEHLNELANEMRIDIIRMLTEAGSGHPGGSLSCTDILCALYFGGVLEYDVENWQGPRDHFIMAKGHAAPALYATLARAGFISRKELLSLRKLGARLQGHPDSNVVPGVEISTGSLGQGLSISCGLGAGLKLQGDEHAVFALLGDGECQEGQVWEAAMFAAHNKLDNVIAIVDRNHLQIDGDTAEVCDLGDMCAKFTAFGWDACEVDGHNIDAVIEVLNAAKADRSGKPHAIIANTIKGKGVSYMENAVGWHGKAPNREQALLALEDLGYDFENAGEPFELVSDEIELPALNLSKGVQSRHVGVLQMASPEEARQKKATRAGYGVTLAKLADEGVPIAAVDADLSCSTTTAKFANAKPEYAKRFFNAGIAEQNMIGIASGLSLAGFVVFTGSFAVFGTGRAYDQIRNTVCYSNLNVKIAPSHAGISVGPDGGSHQMLEDITIMRGIPNMRVLVPADCAAAAAAVRLAANTPGPVYVRMGRAPVPCVYADGVQLEIGRSYVLNEGDDVTIVACGVEVEQARIATERLAEEGISVELIDAFSVKPLDVETIATSARKTGAVVTAEEHSIVGGMGSAVAEALATACPVPIEFVGMRDMFGKSGAYEELSTYFQMDATAIVEAVKRVIARKQAC